MSLGGSRTGLGEWNQTGLSNGMSSGLERLLVSDVITAQRHRLRRARRLPWGRQTMRPA